MRHFSAEGIYTPPFTASHYSVEDPGDMYVCMVHLSDLSDESASSGVTDLLDHLGESDRERRLNLMEDFGTDATKLLEVLEALAGALATVDGEIMSAIDASDDPDLTAEQRELVLSVDGGSPDDMIAAGQRAAAILPEGSARTALLELEAAQLGVDEQRGLLVAILLKHEPGWHRENRELVQRLREIEMKRKGTDPDC